MVEESGRRWWARAFELVGVWSIAIAYPMIQGATSGPDAFTLAAFDGLDVLIFLAILILLVPLVAAGAESLIRLGSRKVADWFHATLVALCSAVLSWQVTQSASQSSALRHLVPLAVFTLVLWAYLNFDPIRQVFALAAFAPLVIVAVALLSNPARSTVLPASDPPSNGKAKSNAPVIFLVLDELPLVALLNDQERIDRRMFPGFAELAEHSTWYSRARASADFTVRALPAILTGKAASKQQVPPTRRNYPENLFTLLAEAGYEVSGRETRTTLCPKSSCPSPDSRAAKLVMALENAANYGEVLPRNLELKIVNRLTSPLPKVNRDQAEHLRDFVRTVKPISRSMEFLHVELPHFPWQLFPDGTRHNGPYYVGMVAPGGPYTDATWTTPLADQGMQRMMLQLSFVDRQIQDLLDKLRASEAWEETMLVVMADHGASFEQGLERRHISQQSAGWQVPVPIFVKYPGQTVGSVIGRPVSTSDVVPTVVDTLGLEMPDGVAGVSLKEEPRGELPPHINYFGEEVDVTETVVAEGLSRALKRRNKLFNNGDFYALAGRGDLIGQPTEKLGLEKLVVEVDPLGHLDHIDLEGEEVASYWSGYVREGVKPQSGKVAIAVNGRIATTVPVWRESGNPGSWRVEAILPPETLRQGRNEVVAYALP